MVRDLCPLYNSSVSGYPKSSAGYNAPTFSEFMSGQKFLGRDSSDFKLRPFLIGDFIRVQRRSDTLWSVTRGIRDADSEDFKIKFHAVAYARALSCSLHLILYIDDGLGNPIEQSAASLTYPTQLE